MPVRLGRFRLVPRHCGAKASPGAIRSSETAERSCWLSSPFRSACAGLNTEHAKGILGPEKIRPPWTNIDHTTGNHNRPGETAARMFFTRTKTTLARSAGSLGLAEIRAWGSDWVLWRFPARSELLSPVWKPSAPRWQPLVSKLTQTQILLIWSAALRRILPAVYRFVIQEPFRKGEHTNAYAQG